METIAEIFDKRLFRIPDYQRGYSWKELHLDDFWQDLQNLQLNKRHYTGALTFEHSNPASRKFKQDQWLISSAKYSPIYVVDGQQRLTTIVILIHTLVEYLEEGQSYKSYSAKQIIQKYLYKEDKGKNLRTYMFGYEIDDPSYEFLKTRIFKQQSTNADKQPETSYTNNLAFCKRFFQSRVQELDHQQKESLFIKTTELLLFDTKFIEELDKFVVFETMNNRGKPLTNLEKLKNRFIYLSTLIPGLKENEADLLRNEINDVWKSCYTYLGKNKKHALADDIFLRNHFIVFHYFNKEKGFPFRQIFKEIYTVERTLDKHTLTRYKDIRRYISSLQQAAKQWYIINNPEHAFNDSIIGAEEMRWLVKIRRLGLRIFGPLTMAVYLTTDSENDRIKYLLSLEAFIFLNYVCNGRRSTYGSADFSNMARMLYYQENGISLSKVISTLDGWTYGNDEFYADFSTERMIVTIRDLFRSSKRNGYYDWPGIKYFLFEYDEHLRGNEKAKVDWETPDSIEHIYPQNPQDSSWSKAFSGYTEKQRRILRNSLGNLLLLHTSKNSKLSNREFSYKREHVSSSGKSYGGYKYGSHSEIHVSKHKVWNPRKIYQRGLLMLEFFQNNWEVKLTRKEIKNLLLVDDTLIKKIR